MLFDIASYALSFLIVVYMSINMRAMRRELTQLDTNLFEAHRKIGETRDEVSHIYLTAEERQQLGIPTPTVPDLPAPEKPPVLVCKPSKHQWPAHYIGAPQLPSNQQKAETTTEYGGFGGTRRIYKIPVRVCIVCGTRQVRDKHGSWYLD